MLKKLQRWLARRQRRVTHTTLSYYIYRYRYLGAFTLFGFLSIVLEIILVQYALPSGWPWLPKSILAFLLGLSSSFALNATLNFCVPRRYLLATLGRFALVSCFTFILNMLGVYWSQELLGPNYGVARLLCSGTLFLIAFALHRRFTFDMARNFGIAVYASSDERVYRIFHKIGRNCDHVHVDLVDETMNPACAPVDLGRLQLARRLWTRVPVCLHVMSLRPSRWLESTWDCVDWYLFHVNAQENLLGLIAECRLRKKKVGVVWHGSASLEELLPCLPHVDFVMVLGIANPGRSGQPISERALAMADLLDDLRPRYGYEVIFDGSVNLSTIGRIRARYIVAASAVLRATDPIRSVNSLKSGAKYERRVA